MGAPATIRLPTRPVGDFERISPATRFVDLPEVHLLHRGGFLRRGRVAYESLGVPNARRSNTVLVLTGLSADAHIASHPEDPMPGWWEGMVGPGRAIDTDRWNVVCVNSIGSCFGSSGPASVDLATLRPYRLTFPEVSVEDMADAAAHVLSTLGVRQAAAVVGCSMGAMAALSLITRHPQLAAAHVSVCGAPMATDFAIAVRSIQREAIRHDQAWAAGDYTLERFPRRGMLTARKLGMLTYRGMREWESRFGRGHLGSPGSPFAAEFAVEAYLQRQADRFVDRFDPNSYLYLSRASDRFDGPLPPTLPALRKALVLGASTDVLSPTDQQEAIAQHLRRAGVPTVRTTLASPHGHDSFLVDVSSFGNAIGAFLSTLPTQHPKDHP